MFGRLKHGWDDLQRLGEPAVYAALRPEAVNVITGREGRALSAQSMGPGQTIQPGTGRSIVWTQRLTNFARSVHPLRRSVSKAHRRHLDKTVTEPAEPDRDQ